MKKTLFILTAAALYFSVSTANAGTNCPNAGRSRHASIIDVTDVSSLIPSNKGLGKRPSALCAKNSNSPFCRQKR